MLRRMTNVRTLRRLALAITLGSMAPPVQAAETNTDLNRAWAAGYRAAFTCSSLWNGAGKSLEAIERDELTGIYREIEADVRALKADVDNAAKRVSVAYRDDMPPRVAQWTGRDGCVTLPIGGNRARWIASSNTDLLSTRSAGQWATSGRGGQFRRGRQNSNARLLT